MKEDRRSLLYCYFMLFFIVFSFTSCNSENSKVSVDNSVIDNVNNSPKKPWEHGKLQLSSSKHMLEHEDGTGFFWMADTAWFAVAKLNREEIDKYLSNRAEKGFSVVMVNIMSRVGHNNAYGDRPYPVNWEDKNAYKVDQFITTLGNNPNDEEEYDYWDHVAYMIDKAAEKNIYIAIVLTWGADAEKYVEKSEHIYQSYINQLTTLFKNKSNIIWINGGDVFDEKLMTKPQWDWIGNAIKKEDPNHLLGFHGNPSSYAHHHKSWLDFNMIESGHAVDTIPQNQMIIDDYRRVPVKPVLDGESRYEDIAVDENRTHIINAREVREIEYYQLFSGAFGVTFGHNSIWQMAQQEDVDKLLSEKKGYEQVVHPLRTWKEALDSPASFEMQYLGKLICSRPLLKRVPEPSLIVGRVTTAKAILGEGYAMVYSSLGKNLDINLGKVSGVKVNIWSYNPRIGEPKALEVDYDNSGIYTFIPEDNKDWVVVIDDASKGYGKPGA